MKIVADEGVDGPIVARLRQDGHEVDYVAQIEPGMSDDSGAQPRKRTPGIANHDGQ